MKLFTFLFVTKLCFCYVFGETMQSCDSKIYCQGELLNTVQYTHKLFPDSKSFVDRSQINDPEVTLANFENLMNSTKSNPTKKEVERFVNENFLSEGELEEWTPSDYTENPAFLKRISDREVYEFAKDIVQIWPKLARKVKSDVKENPGKHSLIYMPNGFIIPGGRFKEIYYWDSYWIIKGLLISEMSETVKGMLENFLHLVKTYGFIPNGSRVYYLNRSQPPLLSLMVGLYIDATRNIDWLKENIQTLEDELTWWLNNRTIEVVKNSTVHTLARYASESGTPRPESYSEDIVTCNRFQSKAKESCYKNLKSGAESGWDFSTRWISENGTDISFVDVYRIVPVDLNAYLCKAFKELSRFHVLLGNVKNGALWWERANTWQKSIDEVLYDQEDGIWYDYDISTGQLRKNFYPSNFAPLWSGAYNDLYKNQLGSKAARYFRKKINEEYYLGGIPTSIRQSGEQWDLPNAWPPLQEIVVLGLYKTDNIDAKDIALTYAKRWITANQIGYKKDAAMYEKYDAIEPGKYGGGGEYEVQAGFGWSNGVAFSFIDEFPELFSGAELARPSKILSSYISLLLLAFHWLRVLF